VQVFNGTFFGTAATVIPVLFLALTLQGNFVIKVLLEAAKLRARERKARVAPSPGSHTLKTVVGREARSVGAQLLSYAGTLVPFDAVWGEIAAIRALENRTASSADTSIVMQAVIVLTVAAGIALLVRFFSALAKEREESKKEEGEPAS
jgi:hypothetical protein